MGIDINLKENVSLTLFFSYYSCTQPMRKGILVILQILSLTPFFPYYSCTQPTRKGILVILQIPFFQFLPLFFSSSLPIKRPLSRLPPTTPSAFSVSLSLPSLKPATLSPLPPWLLHRSHPLPFLTTTHALIISLRRSSFQYNNNVSAINFF